MVSILRIIIVTNLLCSLFLILTIQRISSQVKFIRLKQQVLLRLLSVLRFGGLKNVSSTLFPQLFIFRTINSTTRSNFRISNITANLESCVRKIAIMTCLCPAFMSMSVVRFFYACTFPFRQIATGTHSMRDYKQQTQLFADPIAAPY